MFKWEKKGKNTDANAYLFAPSLSRLTSPISFVSLLKWPRAKPVWSSVVYDFLCLLFWGIFSNLSHFHFHLSSRTHLFPWFSFTTISHIDFHNSAALWGLVLGFCFLVPFAFQFSRREFLSWIHSLFLSSGALFLFTFFKLIFLTHVAFLWMSHRSRE